MGLSLPHRLPFPPCRLGTTDLAKPRRPSFHYGVVDFIHTGANPILRGLCAFSGNLPSLFYGLRISDSVGAVDIPTIYRVGFAE